MSTVGRRVTDSGRCAPSEASDVVSEQVLEAPNLWESSAFGSQRHSKEGRTDIPMIPQLGK
jgi:hypothetical protein